MLDSEQEQRFCKARRAAIALDYANLNPEQRKGVLATEGPLLLLAGAGSGKTTVLIHRIANLIKYGRGSDSPEVPEWVEPEDLDFLEQYVRDPAGQDKAKQERLCRVDPAVPWSIIAITFTNKAAGELKARLEKMLGPQANDVWASTFHSACVRILRRDIDRLGYRSDFTIYDTSDCERLVRDIMKDLRMDEEFLKPRQILNIISKSKDRMEGPDTMARDGDSRGDIRKKEVARIFAEYERRLRDANALDFDDIILHTVRILRDFEEVRTYYQKKFRYVLIDEYQDTNHLQYLLATYLAGGRENICVVGDDDQSIYRFRGANIENILSFEKEYHGARTIRLEQNYRSTSVILEAANEVIRNNTERKGKELWTDRKGGQKIRHYNAMDERDEAQYVVNRMVKNISEGRQWKDHVVLYRTNAQSKQIEQAFKRSGIPYRVFGGTRFYDRAEVKDMLAYLCVINNPDDDLRLMRIINTPARGIGETTLSRVRELAADNGLSDWQVVRAAREYPELQKAAGKLEKFVLMIEDLRARVRETPLPEFYGELVEETGYGLMLRQKNTAEDQARLENVQELESSIQEYLGRCQENGDAPSVAGFLEAMALYTDLDNRDNDENCAVMMTMHSAKGLEFPVVFMVGVEDNIFPGFHAIGDREEMEEERRLCYVAITRAKEELHMVNAEHRMLFGKTSANCISRFLKEIPGECVEELGQVRRSAERTESGFHRPERARPVFDRGYSGGTGYGRSSGLGGSGTRSGGSRVVASGGTASNLPGFHKGDTVVHTAFGRGLITGLTPMGGDALIEVAFEEKGTRKLMLKAAAQHMKKV